MSKREELIQCIYHGENDKVASMLEGPVIEAIEGETHPIAAAIDSHNDKGLELLVNSGWYDISKKITWFHLPLSYAVNKANVFAVSFLLENGHATIEKDTILSVVCEIADEDYLVDDCDHVNDCDEYYDCKKVVALIEILHILLKHGGLDQEKDLVYTLWDTTNNDQIDYRVVIPLLEAGVSPFLQQPRSTVTFYSYVRYKSTYSSSASRIVGHIRKHQTLYTTVLHQRLDALKHLN